MQIYSGIPDCTAGPYRGGKGGTIIRAPNNYGGAENPNSITSAFFNPQHLLPKDLRFEHGDAKVASYPGRHPGLPPEFSSRGGQKPEGWATFLKYGIGCMEQPGGQTRNRGEQISNGRPGTTGPRWRRLYRHLTSLPLCCTGSKPEIVFCLCKLPKSYVSYRFSIAFLFSLLLFLSKLASSVINELVKNINLHSSATSPEVC